MKNKKKLSLIFIVIFSINFISPVTLSSSTNITSTIINSTIQITSNPLTFDKFEINDNAITFYNLTFANSENYKGQDSYFDIFNFTNQNIVVDTTDKTYFYASNPASLYTTQEEIFGSKRPKKPTINLNATDKQDEGIYEQEETNNEKIKNYILILSVLTFLLIIFLKYKIQNLNYKKKLKNFARPRISKHNKK